MANFSSRPEMSRKPKCARSSRSWRVSAIFRATSTSTSCFCRASRRWSTNLAAGDRMRFDQLKRREFITLLGGAATWPIAARGQQWSIPVIGFINGSSATAYAAYVQAFIRGLAEAGYRVGENVVIEYRWAEGHYDRIPDMVDDLVRRRVAVLAPNTPAAHATKR